jgi:hypothetical protein
MLVGREPLIGKQAEWGMLRGRPNAKHWAKEFRVAKLHVGTGVLRGVPSVKGVA